jgi:hypothetical protein
LPALAGKAKGLPEPHPVADRAAQQAAPPAIDNNRDPLE